MSCSVPLFCDMFKSNVCSVSVICNVFEFKCHLLCLSCVKFLLYVYVICILLPFFPCAERKKSRALYVRGQDKRSQETEFCMFVCKLKSRALYVLYVRVTRFGCFCHEFCAFCVTSVWLTSVCVTSVGCVTLLCCSI